MENKEQISKGFYLFMVWAMLVLGIILNAIFSTSLMMNGWNYYYFAWSSVACIMIGTGIGLASARAFKIKGVDK